jgi:NhaA family Na+:H+ antiporter
MYRVSPFVRHFARALIGGVVVATGWVNLDPSSYYDAIELRLADLPMPDFTGVADLTLTPMSIVSEGLMALFLFFIGKELWEAIALERGALSSRAQRLMPIGAVVGGMLGAAAGWTLWSLFFVTAEEAFFATGWPRGVTVPFGSDVVLC